jgi:hypothetical protein
MRRGRDERDRVRAVHEREVNAIWLAFALAAKDHSAGVIRQLGNLGIEVVLCDCPLRGKWDNLRSTAPKHTIPRPHVIVVSRARAERFVGRGLLGQ